MALRFITFFFFNCRSSSPQNSDRIPPSTLKSRSLGKIGLKTIGTCGNIIFSLFFFIQGHIWRGIDAIIFNKNFAMYMYKYIYIYFKHSSIILEKGRVSYLLINFNLWHRCIYDGLGGELRWNQGCGSGFVRICITWLFYRIQIRSNLHYDVIILSDPSSNVQIVSFHFVVFFEISVVDSEWFIPDPDSALNFTSSGSRQK